MTLTWVVMGLNTPAGFWVTMVLVTEGAGGDNVGLAVVTRGPLGLKLTAAMGAADLTWPPLLAAPGWAVTTLVRGAVTLTLLVKMVLDLV